MMLKVLIYAYDTGIFSSRKIEKALYESIPYIYLSGWQTPDFRTISDFLKDNHEELKSDLKQVAAICKGLGMIKLRHISIDGAKIKANASDSKTYNEKKINREIKNSWQRPKRPMRKKTHSMVLLLLITISRRISANGMIGSKNSGTLRKS